MGLETEVLEPLLEHGFVSDAAVGYEEESFVVLAQVVQSLDAGLYFFRSYPLSVGWVTMTPSRSKKKVEYLWAIYLMLLILREGEIIVVVAIN